MLCLKVPFVPLCLNLPPFLIVSVPNRVLPPIVQSYLPFGRRLRVSSRGCEQGEQVWIPDGANIRGPG